MEVSLILKGVLIESSSTVYSNHYLSSPVPQFLDLLMTTFSPFHFH